MEVLSAASALDEVVDVSALFSSAGASDSLDSPSSSPLSFASVDRSSEASFCAGV